VVLQVEGLNFQFISLFYVQIILHTKIYIVLCDLLGREHGSSKENKNKHAGKSYVENKCHW